MISNSDLNEHRRNPQISVIMSAHNSARYLESSIKSILNQTIDDFEYIIVNDASTDGTEEILKQFDDPRIKLLPNTENLGLTKSLNKAVQLAKGKYIARMDADDISLSHRFETQLNFLDNNPDYAIVGSSYYQIDEKGRAYAINNVLYEDADIRKELRKSNCFAHGSIMMRKSIFQKAGGYDERYAFAQDYDLWLRISEISKVANIREPLYCWRETRSSISVHKQKEQEYYANLAISEAYKRDQKKSVPEGAKIIETAKKDQLWSKKTLANLKDAPLVSVVVPCYNQAQFLPEAINSIVKQTYNNWECIIVNDGSTDDTSEVSKRLISQYPANNIHLVEQENGGVASARNAGIAVSSGKYILSLDTDDMIAEGMIEKCVILLESDPDTAIAYTSIQQFGDSRATVPLREYDFHTLCKINFLTCTALFRREAFNAAGGYNTNMTHGYEDWDFWIGCGEKGFYGRHIPEPLFLERITESSMFSTSLKYDKVLKAQIILNHQSIFTQSQILWAKGVLADDSNILALIDISGIIPEFYDPLDVKPESQGKPFTDSMKEDLNKAMQFYQEGNLKQVEHHFRKALKENPDVDRVNYELANVLYSTGQLFEAIAYYQKTLQVNPELIDIYNDLGLAYHETGLLDEAIKCYLKALLLDPTLTEVLFNLGLVFAENGYFDQSIKCYQEVIEKNPNFEDAYINLGNIYLRKRNYDEAIASYEKVLLLNPNIAEAYNNLGYALYEEKEFKDSIECLKKAADINPNLADTYYNLGNAHKQLHQFDEAITYYDRALAIKPVNPEIYLNRGYIFEYDGRNEEAILEYNKAIEQYPDFFLAHFARCIAQLKAVSPDQQSIHAARSRYQEELQGLSSLLSFESQQEIDNAARAVGSQQPFLLAYHGLDDRELQKIYGQLICNIMSMKYPQFAERPAMPSYSDNEPIRVGIVSGYFHEHSNWKIPISGWLENLDRQRFHIHGYYTGDKYDQATESAKTYCTKFVDDISSFEEICRSIRNDRLHILIFPEIGMDPTTVRLAALRLAPVQCTSWGHPDTSGLPTIDYYMSSDLMEPPEADKYYTEELIRLPHLSIYYNPLDIPAISGQRESFGLRPDSILYLCSQSLRKYLPQYDEVFPQIALKVVDCQFAFISDTSTFITEQFRSRLRAAFKKFQLEADQFCIFLPYLDPAKYHAINLLSDIYLDSIGWSGCNSSLEALACNLPIVTIPGTFMRGRHTSAILTMMNMTETIASTLDEYISFAVRLGKDLQWRKQISKMISENKHLVYRDKTCITGLEDFFVKIVKERL
jgi:protein O-GlcNAc transferase